MSAGHYTYGMGFLPPMPVTLDCMSTNVPASALAAWSATTSYALGAEIIDADRMIWRSMAANNIGNDPATTAAAGKWQKRGVENRLRAFDGSLGSYVEYDDLIEFVITPARVLTDVMLLGVQAYTVQLIMSDPLEGLLLDTGEVRMLRPSGNSHWGYFFHPIESKSKLHIHGLPAYTQATITIRLRNQGARVRCGQIVLGRAVWLGHTQWRPSISFDDWSSKKRDDWGGWKVEQGLYSDRLKLQVLVAGSDYERTRNAILACRAKPVVWMGARGFDVLTTYGYMTGFEQVLVHHAICDCSMTIEGLEQ